MTEVTVNEQTKGVLVFGKSKDLNLSDCLLLIESVRLESYYDAVKTNYVYRHAAIKLGKNDAFENFSQDTFIGGGPHRYGKVKNYKFYKPTKKQMDTMKNFLAKSSYRFDKENNKLIKV